MKKMFNSASVILFSMALIAIFSTPSCKKETDCTAIITVVDTNGTAIEGVLVYLGPPNPIPAGQKPIEQNLNTDASGKATFVFELEATLDITASKDTKSGSSIITLKPGETVEKTVTIQ